MSARGCVVWLLLAVGAAAMGGCAASQKGAAGRSGAAIDPRATPADLIAISDSAIASADPDRARRALQRAAELDPQSAAVRVAYGRYYTAIRRYRDAKAAFDQAAALDPRSPEPDYWLGIAYLGAGQEADAFQSFARALRLDPRHEGARRGIRPLREKRYVAAGVPREYAEIPERPSVSRGELAVIMAVEMGLDPDRLTWRSDAARRVDWPGIDAAWGSRWVRASLARGWIRPLADRALHLEDPLTRGALALVLVEVQAQSAAPSGARPDTSAGSAGSLARAGRTAFTPRGADASTFTDLGSRHYLARPASRAAVLGLAPRPDGRFEPQALATGDEVLRAVRGLAVWSGVLPVVSGEPDQAPLVK